MPEPDHDRRGYFARNVSSILESGAMRFPVSPEIFKGTHFTAIAFYKTFLGPRGPLRTPLMSVRRPVVPSSATFSHATSHYSFSDSKLILFLFQTLSSRNLSHSTQYTEH